MILVKDNKPLSVGDLVIDHGFNSKVIFIINEITDRSIRFGSYSNRYQYALINEPNRLKQVEITTEKDALLLILSSYDNEA